MNRSHSVILENGIISIDMTVPYSVKGTPLNDEQIRYRTELNAYIQESREKYAIINQNQNIDEETRNKQIVENRNLYGAKIDSLCTVFFLANKNNALGVNILLSTWHNLDPVRLDWLYSQAGDIVREYNSIQEIIDDNNKKLRTTVGMPFTDFTIENGNRDGSKASLSDYVGKGKYVLVDFWGSWCGPCIAEIPFLTEIYNKYKGDKFEILGIAVKDKLEDTMKAIETHNITWSQILNAGEIPIELYGINIYPNYILFGPDGKIVACNLRGDILKMKIAELMQ